MNTLKANTNKPWLSPEYDIPVLENEEMWSQQVIDTSAQYLLNDIEKDFFPRFKEYYNSEDLRTCKKCGHVMETDPKFT